MPFTDQGLTVEPLSSRIAALQSALVDAMAAQGQPTPAFDGTIEGALVEWAALLAFQIEDRERVIVDALTPDHASSANLDRHGAAALIPRLDETRSRYTVNVGSGVVGKVITLEKDTIFEHRPSSSFGFVVNARTLWRAVETTEVPYTGAYVVVESVDPGPITLPSGEAVILYAVTSYDGLGATWDSRVGQPYTIGRDRETDGAYRARLRSLRSTSLGPTYDGIRARLLAVPWVRAVSFDKQAAGVILPTIVPTPVGADQTAELVTALREAFAFGNTFPTPADHSETVTLPGGETLTVRWDDGTEVAVPVAVEFTTDTNDPGDLLALTTPIEEAVAGVFGALDVGSTVRRLALVRAIAAVSPRIVSVSVLLNGLDADYAVTSTQIAVPGTITVAQV